MHHQKNSSPFPPSYLFMGSTPANDVNMGTLSLPAASTLEAQPLSLYQNLQAESPDALYKLGRQHLEARSYGQAIQPFNRLIQLNPNNPDILSNLAFCLYITGRLELALKTYELALRVAPQSTDILRGLAYCYKAKGSFDIARDFFKEALKIAPQNVECLYNLVLLSDYDVSAPIVQQLKTLHETLQAPYSARVMVCFALAKIYETSGEFQQAFSFYQEGNRLQYNNSSYDEAGLFQYLDILEDTFSAELFAELGTIGNPDATPIFVLGMPRSGTSLIEQILASHPLVHGAGELIIMPDIAARLIPQLTGQNNPRAIYQLNQSAVSSIAEHYINNLRSHCAPEKRHIVDKMPNNFFNIGLIKLLLPNAKIIHCTRDPMVTCWSLYRQHFGGTHPYCYNQTILGKFYLRYEQLMQHWKKALPHSIYDVSYEDVVQNPEVAVAAMLEHCNLPWDDKCLKFYNTDRTVNTASMRQVRQPLYQTSLQSWQPMAHELTNLIETLGYPR